MTFLLRFNSSLNISISNKLNTRDLSQKYNMNNFLKHSKYSILVASSKLSRYPETVGDIHFQPQPYIFRISICNFFNCKVSHVSKSNQTILQRKIPSTDHQKYQHLLKMGLKYGSQTEPVSFNFASFVWENGIIFSNNSLQFNVVDLFLPENKYPYVISSLSPTLRWYVVSGNICKVP